MDKKEKAFNVDGAANNLFKLFEDNTFEEDGAQLATEKGLGLMSEFFGTVPMEERGYVFIAFLGMLYETDRRYDKHQFLNMEAVEEDGE